MYPLQRPGTSESQEMDILLVSLNRIEKGRFSSVLLITEETPGMISHYWFLYPKPPYEEPESEPETVNDQHSKPRIYK